MLVSSNNSLLNILLPNDNKVLKDVLKNADAQTLESFKKGNGSVKDILNNLFTDMKNANKNSANIENILKNSNMFKDLGSFSKSVTTLLSQIESDANLSKFKPILQSFAKDIASLDDKSLKDLINKSGVFLESKALEQLKSGTNLPKNLETILNQIKTILKDIPTLDAKKIESLIDKILQNNQKPVGNPVSTQNQSPTQQTQNSNDIKTLVSQLQNLSKGLGDKQLANLTSLTNSLKNISTQAQLVESKINNSTVNQQTTVPQQTSQQTSVQQGTIQQAVTQQTISQQAQTPTAGQTLQTQNLQTQQPLVQQNSNPTQQVQTPNLQGTQTTQQVAPQIGNQNIQEAIQKVVTNTIENLSQLKTQVQVNSNIPNTQNITNQIDTLIQSKELLTKPETLVQAKNILTQLINSSELKNASVQNSAISNLLTNIKSQGETLTQLASALTKVSQANVQANTQTTQQVNIQQPQNTPLSNELLQAKQSVNTKVLDTLSQIKNELLTNQNIPNTQNIVKQIDTLIQSSDLFSRNNSLIEPKSLISQLTNLTEIKTAANQSPNIASLVNNLKNQSESISILENKVLQNQNISGEKLQLTNDIQQTLSSLKAEVSTMPNIDSKGINQIIDRLLNLQNLFTKIEIPLDMKNLQQSLLNNTTTSSSFQSNFSSNINSLILTLKENIINLSSNQSNLNLQQNVLKGVEKLETILNNIIQNPNLLADKQLPQNSIQNDMKAVLLQMQSELAGKTDLGSQETLKQIDKMVTQVEYHQLLSLVSNSNSVYIPFIWDMLDEGSIAMKKADEDKFYCEINLSLKEFGQTQLLLSLYDKNKLDLTIYASKDSFKQSIRENSTKLKQALNSVDLIPVNINIIELKQEEEKESKQTNVYNQNANLGFGLDIRA